MSESLEIEYKTLLTKEEWQRLIDDLQLSHHIEQTNYYFDYQHHLQYHHAALRIRRINYHAEMTLKTKTDDGHLETTETLSLSEWQAFKTTGQLPYKASIEQKLNEWNISLLNMKEIAHLHTMRYEKVLNDTDTIMLDKSTYYHQDDYELEMEVTDAETGWHHFNSFLSKHHIEFRQSQPKIARAMQAKHASELV